MKRILYISNIEVPYRVRFFNELAKYCDLTVLYERKHSGSRDEQWASSEKQNYRSIFLKGINISHENAFTPGLFRYLFGKYDGIVVGCYNSPVQVMAILALRFMKFPYYLNIDGESFLEGKGLKISLKRFIVKGARTYFTAGEKSALSLKKAIGQVSTIPYYFSSLSEDELQSHKTTVWSSVCKNTVLIVGQYLDVKGLDVALQVARENQQWHFQFVGMGKRTAQFVDKYHPEQLKNVEIIPFLQKKDLEEAYRNCTVLVLPSRKECWGLVVNEAASFGVPIVSTWGSGAAVEFLSDDYPQLLAKPGDPESLRSCIDTLFTSTNREQFAAFLRQKSQQYSIEKSVQAHLAAFDKR